MRVKILLLCVSLAALLLTACGDTNKEAFPTPVNNPQAGVIPPTAMPGPVPGATILFPNDEAPHDVITEWWYYTGHLVTNDGRKYGFEYVIFQASRGNDNLRGYSSHFAITDLADSSYNADTSEYNLGQASFSYDQKQVIGNSTNKLGGKDGFNLAVGDWTMKGRGGVDHLQAKMSDGKYAINLDATDSNGVALHGGGLFSYGGNGSSYYYSRPIMDIKGQISIAGNPIQVTGIAWFDHQWGNFLVGADGFWDWFSTQFDDKSALMLYRTRDSQGKVTSLFGSYIPACKDNCSPDKPLPVIELKPQDFTIFKVTSNWSLNFGGSGIAYPIGWKISVKADKQRGLPSLELNYQAGLPNQELDTRKSTNNIYWEGDSYTTGTRNGNPIKAQSYIELTGYQPQV